MRVTHKPDHYLELIEEFKLCGISSIWNNDKVTNAFTPYGNVQILFYDRECNKKVYEIIDRYRKYFYFRFDLGDDGSISIWIYKTKKSYKDHVNHILNNLKKR